MVLVWKMMSVMSLQINLGSWGFQRLALRPDKLCGAMFWVYSHLQPLQHCFAVKKCFVDYETWPRFPSACGWVDNELILVLGGTVPYKFQFPKKVVFFISHHTHQILTLWDCVGSAATQKHQYLILSWEFFQTGPLSFVCENNGSSLLNSTKSYLLETLNKPDSSLWIRLDKHNTVLD